MLIILWIIGHIVEKATSSAVNKKILLIFAKQPVAGAAKTRLCPPLTPDEAARVYEAMLFDVLESTADLPGIERWLCFGPSPTAADYFRSIAPELHQLPQQGADLGERLITAMDAAFAHGADQVAVIGTDAPDLPVNYIAKAFTSLDNSPESAVFGPATDGGYYLAALARPCPDLFQRIAWSSAEVLATTLTRAASSGIRALLLPQWNDIDTWAELAMVAARKGPHHRTQDLFIRIGKAFPSPTE